MVSECFESFTPMKTRFSKLISLCLAAFTVAFANAAHHGTGHDLPPSIDVGKRPESVTRGFGGDLFVTVMNGKEKGDGVVKRIHGGKVTVFATGLDEPKGIAFVGDHLVTTDLLRVWKINAKGEATVIATAEDFPEEILYLNDAAAAPGGGVYITDMGDKDKMRDSSGEFYGLDSTEAKQIEVVGRVYHVSLDGEATLALGPSDLMLCPNGVGVGRDGQLLVGAFFTGNLLEAHDGHLRVVAAGMRGADAVEQDQRGNYYVSSWSQGKAWKVNSKGKKTVLVEGLKSAADFYFDREEEKLYLPDMLAGKVYIVSL